jgi:hypothetical protein
MQARMSIAARLVSARASAGFKTGMLAGAIAVAALAGFVAASHVVGAAPPASRDNAPVSPSTTLSACSMPIQLPVSRFKIGYLEFEDEPLALP